MNILPDLSARKAQALRPVKRYMRHDPLPRVHGASEKLARGLRLDRDPVDPWERAVQPERVHDTRTDTMVAVRRRPRPKPMFRPYKPQDGHQAGPLFRFIDVSTGEQVERCRGTLHHVMAEKARFCASVGARLDEVRLEVVS